MRLQEFSECLSERSSKRGRISTGNAQFCNDLLQARLGAQSVGSRVYCKPQHVGLALFERPLEELQRLFTIAQRSVRERKLHGTDSAPACGDIRRKLPERSPSLLGLAQERLQPDHVHSPGS